MGDSMCPSKLPDTESVRTAVNTPLESPLLILPGELRNMIWRMLLTTSYAFKEPNNNGDCEARYEMQPAILRVNRQIYNETHRILKEENRWIFVCILTPKRPGHSIDEKIPLPVVSQSILVDHTLVPECYFGIASHALSLFLSQGNSVNDYHCDCHTMIMGPESLPYLMQMLFAMFYTHRSVPAYRRKDIQMYFGSPVCFTSSRLQRELLEPFSAIRGCDFIQINGNVDKNLASSIKYKMRHPFESETELLGFSQAYLEQGDAAAIAGLTKAASFFFEQGSDFTFFAGQSYIDRYHPQAVNVYGFVPTASILTTFDLRWAVTLLKHRCYADVQRLAASVLGRQKQFRATISQRINFVVYCALASLGLGQTARFTRIMRGLSQGICDLGVFPTVTGSTPFKNPRYLPQ